MAISFAHYITHIFLDLLNASQIPDSHGPSTQELFLGGKSKIGVIGDLTWKKTFAPDSR